MKGSIAFLVAAAAIGARLPPDDLSWNDPLRIAAKDAFHAARADAERRVMERAQAKRKRRAQRGRR